MFKYERTTLVGMASEADRILGGRSPDLLRPDGSMRVVTVAALDQPFIHAVVKWHCELRLLLRVARVTKIRLRFDEQEFLLLGMMGGMAIRAGYAVVAVLGSGEIHLFLAGRMAGQATLGDVLR